MIRKSLLTAFILLVLYWAFILINADRITRTGQNQYARNLVSAEEYLYENGQKAHTLILGSSMSSRLVMDSLPKGFYNLSMSGLSVHDGLQLLEKAKQKPRVVMIEMNIVLREANQSFDEDVLHPILYHVREYIPLIRKKYQPLGVLKALYRDRMSVSQDYALFTLPKEVYESEVKRLINEFSSAEQIPKIKPRFLALKQAVQRLRASGVQVIFFEMPFHQAATQLKIPRLIRSNFSLLFPSREYTYVNRPSEVYQTTDGVHLAGVEARRYTCYLRNELRKKKPELCME